MVLALASGAVTGLVAFFQARSDLVAAAESKLEALLDTRKTQMGDYLGSIEQDLRFIASNPTVARALNGFTGAWSTMDGDPTKTLQRLYITDNPNPTGEKHRLDKATVSAIEGISSTIAEISEIATVIASAVEEQGAATLSITQSAQQAAAGTAEVSGNIGGINEAATTTGAAADQLLGASGELSRQAETLRGQDQNFLSDDKAA